MKMEIFGPLILTFLSGFSTMLGIILIYVRFKNINKFIVVSLSLSLVVMSLISIFDLFPSSFIYIINYYNSYLGLIISILIFLFGYLTIYAINIKSSSSLYRVGILNMIALMLHNLPEGILVFMGSYINIKYGFKLFLAILFHNIPEGISICVPLYYSTYDKSKAIFYTFLSSLAEPLGGLLTYLIIRNYINNLLISFIMLYVSGLMISLSINEIYKEIKNYNLNNYSFIGYIIGILLYIIIYILN